MLVAWMWRTDEEGHDEGAGIEERWILDGAYLRAVVYNAVCLQHHTLSEAVAQRYSPLRNRGVDLRVPCNMFNRELISKSQ